MNLVASEDHYNFHDLFRLTVRSAQAKARQHFRSEYALFKTDDLASSDLLVTVGPFSLEGSEDSGVVTDRGGGWLYVRERHKVATWRFAIGGLAAPESQLLFDGGLFSMMFLQHYVEQIMRFKLSQRGIALVHAGCVARGGTSVLFPGRGKSGKTALVLQQVLAGEQFQADDYTLVTSTGQTLCYPRRLHISQHISSVCPEALRHVSLKHRLFIRAKYLIYLLTLKYGELTEPLQLAEMLPRAAVARTARLGAVVLLKSGECGEVRGLRPVSGRELVNQVMEINREEGGRRFPRVLLKLQEKGDGDLAEDWWRRERAVLEQALSGVPGYEIVVPRKAASPKATLAQVGRLAAGVLE